MSIWRRRGFPRSARFDDWALIIEVFGFSPRAGIPDTHIYTFAGTLLNRRGPEDYVHREAYENYLRNNPNNESRFIFPLEEGDWLDGEFVSENAPEIVVRDEVLALPAERDLKKHGIDLSDKKGMQVFELCRYLAGIRREKLLSTFEELRVNVDPHLTQVLQLQEWNHPDVVDEKNRPSGSETFQQLAEVLVTGDVGKYRPSLAPNTHWRNWPEGGTL